MRLILPNRFLVGHKPFVRMIKLQFLIQFLVDHLAHPVVSSRIFFLRYFAPLAHVIDRFVSVTT